MKTLAALLALSLSCGFAVAVEAPPGQTKFNEMCPAPKLLPMLREARKSCSVGASDSCVQFVRIFRDLLPTYDCQRDFDRTEDKNYIVPAIWLAGDADFETSVRLLASLRSDDARRLFGSPEFRKVLDGYLAEEFLERSKMVQKENERHLRSK